MQRSRGASHRRGHRFPSRRCLAARRAAPLAVIAALARAAPAVADESGRGEVYFDGSVGAGLGLLDYGHDETDLNLGTVHRLGKSLALSLTATPVFPISKHFALGAVHEIAALPTLSVVTVYPLGSTQVDGAALASLSPVLLYRPWRSGLEVGLSFGVQVTVLVEGSDSLTSAEGQGPNADQGCDVVGPRAGLRIGYVSIAGIGVALRASGASLGICHIANLLGEVTYSSW